MTKDEIAHLYKILADELPLCGCGNPEAGWALVYDLLRLAPFYEHHDEVISLLPTEGVYYLALGALDHVELIEHGSNISGSWLTPKGKWLLGSLDAAGGIAGLDRLFDEVGLPHGGGDCMDTCWVAA